MAGIRVSVGWAVFGLLSIVIVGVLAPQGLWLLGFLALVIVSHEAGHYLVARRGGMMPTEFYWGFGPEVFSVERNGCRYGIRALSVGGYVKLEGMNPSSELPEGFDEAGSFRAAPHRWRVATVLAGPAVNLIVAWVAFVVAALLRDQGLPEAAISAIGDVWFVIDGTASSLVGLATDMGSYLGAVFGANTEPPVRFMSPVGQAALSGKVVAAGPWASLIWLGVLSTAIGVLNLVPLPPLDGSHALVAAVEGTVRKLRPHRHFQLDMKRALPLAWVTVGVLVLISASALVMDIREVALP